MTLKLITAPATEPVSLTEAKLHIRVDNNADDTLITNLIKVAREFCEAWQRRAYVTQTWELYLQRFPSLREIVIPLSPLQSVTSLTYYDEDDMPDTFTGFDEDLVREPGRIYLQHDESWPSVTLRPVNGVVIRFKAGYGNAASVPMTIKQAILLLIGHLYENREAVDTSGKNAIEIPLAMRALLNQNKVYQL